MNMFPDSKPSGRHEEPMPRCGWFDSSHDLRQGLVVQEHESLDSLAGAMSLTEWLTWHNLSGEVTSQR